MCKTNDIGNNVPTNIINNHITMHVISPKLTHMYISYIQRPLSFRNLIYSLLWNEYVLVEMLVYWILPQRRELYGVKTETLPSEGHFATLCSVLTLYLFILTAVKALNAQTAHGLEENTQEQILPREAGS